MVVEAKGMGKDSAKWKNEQKNAKYFRVIKCKTVYMVATDLQICGFYLKIITMFYSNPEHM